MARSNPDIAAQLHASFSRPPCPLIAASQQMKMWAIWHTSNTSDDDEDEEEEEEEEGEEGEEGLGGTSRQM